MLPSILSTKLFVPEIREKHIMRRPQVDKLINGIDSGNKLTLVSAPAGYGKTTLVLELLKSIDITSAWISLDEGDNDIIQFLSYLIAALKKAGVVIGSNTEAASLDFNLASTNAPMTTIINDIATLHQKVILVLDDFHRIYSTQVIDAVKFLLEHQPANLHLVIITREDPGLPLPRLRVQGKITEIRMEDLCFSSDETADFFSKVMGLRLSGEAVAAIAARTEGWIAGLQLAGLSLNGCKEKDVEEFLGEFLGTYRYIIDYLVEEVINRQTEEVREFLCKTSALDRLNGELCDAVVGRSGSRLLLRELEKSNLFLIPLDSKREWYRYHHLFADSLRTELSKDGEMLIHRKAALWLESNGYIQEAIDHAFRSGDMSLSLRLVESNMEQAFNNAQLVTFVKWLNMLPAELVRQSEVLSVRKAWALLMIGHGDETLEYMSSLDENFLDRATPHNKGLLLSLRAAIAQYSGQGDAEKQAEEALRLLEPWDCMTRIATLNTLGRAQEDNGKTTDAVKTLQMAYNESHKLGYTFVTTITLMHLGTNLNGIGRRNEAIELYHEYIDGMTVQSGKPLPFIGIIYVGIAGLYYESNELEKAKSFMDEGSDLCQSIFFNYIENKGIVESRIQFARGERTKAIDTIKKSIEAVQDDEITDMLISNIAVLVELLLRNGNLDEAKPYEETLSSFMSGKSITASRESSLAYARLLIYQGRGKEALELLEGLETNLEKTQKVRQLITFYILYSKTRFITRDYENAVLYFGKAICLAEPQGYSRLFLDEEPIIRDIIFSGKIKEGAFISKLVEYMKTTPSPKQLPVSIPDKETKDIQIKTNGLDHIERLSQREMEILRLLATGLSNDEIAKKLYITVNTAQWHITHIYSKLGVKSRTQAVLKARELEII